MVRVRFSPAPTGYLHVGSARAALFNWLFARHEAGTFLLRIEDTDAERSRPELVDLIFRTLQWLGLSWDEEPVRQSERAELYRQATARLLESGSAYRCDCTAEQVKARTAANPTPGYDGYCRDRDVPPGRGTAVRFKVPRAGSTSFQDVIRGEVSFDNVDLEDFVIQRSDGTATFFLPNAVDDLDMQISHVIRGEDLVNATPRVLLIREALGHPERPVFAHLPLLVNASRKKLSKRRDDVSVEDYRDRGYLPEAVRNYLALLGWGPPDGVEVRPIDEVVALFRLEDVVPSPAFFDTGKLDHLNGEYIRGLPAADFVREALPWVETSGRWPPEAFRLAHFAAIAPAVQERVTTLGEVPDWIDFLFVEDVALDGAAWEKAVRQVPDAAGFLDALLAAYAGCPWDAEALKAETWRLVDDRGVKRAKAQAPIRLAIMGRAVGPPLFESMAVLGRERSRARLAAARQRL